MEQDLQNTVSLYDFLYLDRDRIKSLIAQLNDNGVLQTLKQTNGDKSFDSSELDVGGTANAIVFKAKGKAAIKLGEESNESLELTHDATWSLPLQLLDLLAEKNLITIGSSDSRLGSLSLISGNIVVFDVTTMKKSLPFFANYMELQKRNIAKTLPPKAKKSKKTPHDINELEVSDGMTVGVISNFLDIIPTSVQMELYDDHGNKSWMTLNPEWLTINATDLALKYGSTLPGQWHVLGIIDAIPESLNNSSKFTHEETNEMKSGIYGMIDELKNLLGRSDSQYGITPILMFRAIEA